MSETKEVPFYIELNKLTLEELINLKKLDKDKILGGNKVDIIVSMYMQVPEEDAYNYSPKFFKVMKNLKIDAYKGDWFL